MPNHIADFPAGDAAAPALLLAPGRAYRMDRPIPAQVAQHVVARGVHLARGKSLGSMIAWQLLAEEPQLRGAVLLTPICTPPDGTVDGPYPGIERAGRPLLFVAGAQDRLCEPASLYRFAARAAGHARVNVIAGGHDLGGEAGADLAGRLVADFLAG